MEKADTEIVVIDTAPTGHTLLLLDATQSLSQGGRTDAGEKSREQWQTCCHVLRNPKETEVVIVTLPETTPVFEAERFIARFTTGRHQEQMVGDKLLFISG